MINLPLEIIYYILTFDKRFIIRKGKLIVINKINVLDERYNVLQKKPVIKQFLFNENLDYLQCNRGIVSLGYKNNIKFYIKVIHFLNPINNEKEILHSFNKLKIPLITENNVNNKLLNNNSQYIYKWYDIYIK
jgi:hypothetical protein